MMPDHLNVWSGRKRVGALWRGDDGRLMGFEYDAQWQVNGHAISNSLPLDQRLWPPETLTAHHWFGNLLPEEQARAALIRQLGIPDDDFALLAAIGGDCAGALLVLPPHLTPEALETQSASVPLSPTDLNEWAGFNQRYALFHPSPGSVQPRLSLAGAQDKIPVIWQNERFHLPQGLSSSSHIVKFAVEGRDLIIYNELYLNTLASLVGLPCPATFVRHTGKHALLIVERFDRSNVNGQHVRIHQEDLCQALGLARTHKYQEHGGPHFSECIQRIREVCKPPAPALTQLLRWQIFNALVGNSDGHAKNVSLLQDEKGKWHMAPAYDLVGTVVLGFDPHLAFSIGEQTNAWQLLPRDWQTLAAQSRMSYPFIKREIERLRQRLLACSNSNELKSRLLTAGLPEKAWMRLQQQRQHIAKQCRKAERW
ncbi:HipA domain-containing protein [Halomonas sp. PAMB 3232]|uniref:HipA domain-containing protein n=1 Tax=Halomonas sp. PAMB 3232 TaxID=3075221 RepID=UPI0028968668|nr:HipA domain-containing protein [Halomonas sp. PAMB 3232]WNL37671.1 HipA domain-containing protein [Halomonas sp. PAMB 3232]